MHCQKNLQEDYERLIQALPDAILIVDKEGKILWGNNQLTSLLNYDIKELTGKSVEILVPTNKRIRHVHLCEQFNEHPSKRAMSHVKNLFAQTKDGREIPVYIELDTILWQGNRCSLAILRFRENHYKQKQQLQYAIHYDPLTNLPNRTFFLKSLTEALQKAQNESYGIAIFYIDLDGFKEVNETQGHDVGDNLLQEAAFRLGSLAPSNAIVARLGGDEFALFQIKTNPYSSRHTAVKIINQLKVSQSFSDYTLDITASVGIAHFPAHGSNVTDLLRKADQAVHQAKKQGKSKYQYYDVEEEAKTAFRLQMISDLNDALCHKNFELHYQPKLDLIGNGFFNTEALLRWNHPEKGYIPPMDFIPIAEESGQILPIGAQIFEQACQFIRLWDSQHNQRIKVAINLSAMQLQEENLSKHFINIINRTGIKGESFEFEITESLIMRDVEASLKILNHLKSTGATIAIDDFGTGYSSLSYLKTLPVDTLKIDQSFVANLPDNDDSRTIVSAIVSMSHKLRINVVAEGVETENQLNFLASLGCEQLQGYFIAKPTPENRLPKLIQRVRQLENDSKSIKNKINTL